jgi:hypothetical protein
MQANPNSMSWGIAILGLLLAVFGMSGASYLLSWVSGWHKLAQRYRFEREFVGERWRFQSAGMRWNTAYRGILTVGANAEGLYLAVAFLFRPGHPPLLIPWREITARERRRWMIAGTQFELGQETKVPLWLYANLGTKVLAQRPGNLGIAQDIYSRPGLEPPRTIV